jgi:hypothetical protein
MRDGVLLMPALLVASVYALYPTNYVLYSMWSPMYTLDNFGFYGISVTVGPIRLGEWEVQTVEEVVLDGLPPDRLIKDLSRYRRTDHIRHGSWHEGVAMAPQRHHY